MGIDLRATETCGCGARVLVTADTNTWLQNQLRDFRANHQHIEPPPKVSTEMATAPSTVNVEINPIGFISKLADQLREAANRLDPIDRDELKAVIVTAGDAPAEIADAVVAYLSHGSHGTDGHDGGDDE